MPGEMGNALRAGVSLKESRGRRSSAEPTALCSEDESVIVGYYTLKKMYPGLAGREKEKKRGETSYGKRRRNRPFKCKKCKYCR